MGLWTIRFLLITLAVTPARSAFNWPQILLVRRMLGVTTLAYGHRPFLPLRGDGGLPAAARRRRDRQPLLPDDRLHGAARADRARGHVHEWLDAASRKELEAAAPARLRHRGARAAALLHADQGERVRSRLHGRAVRLADAVAHGVGRLAAPRADAARARARARAPRRRRSRRGGTASRPAFRRRASSMPISRSRYGLRPSAWVALAALAVAAASLAWLRIRPPPRRAGAPVRLRTAQTADQPSA